MLPGPEGKPLGAVAIGGLPVGATIVILKKGVEYTLGGT